MSPFQNITIQIVLYEESEEMVFKCLNNLKNLNCDSFAILSELKKKPANIINRLF